jgi:hypothetical protein
MSILDYYMYSIEREFNDVDISLVSIENNVHVLDRGLGYKHNQILKSIDCY